MSEPADEHVDVLIVGAGLSGVGAACRLAQRCAGKTCAILEARESIGGTWDLFRFPGVRSDSDMFTLAYPFRPWRGAQAIVDGGSILQYVRDTAREYGVEERIRFGYRVLRADWSSADARWRVEAECLDTGERLRITCGFLFACTGYYRYDAGYTPQFPGMERFGGQVVHPQLWSSDVEHADKRVVVIGSGATAVTLVPALSERAAHVTMLQRSPSYIMSVPASDPLAGALGRVLPARLAYRIVRWKNMRVALAIYGLSRRRPAAMKRLLRRAIERRLPAGYDVETHFAPRYEPWDQRLCFVPDHDLFDAIGAGRVSVVTDRIATFTERGVALASGGRPDLRARVPAAAPHGRAGLRRVHAPARRPAGRHRPLCRAHVGVRAAGDRPLPQAAPERSVAPPAALSARPALGAAGSAGRSRAGVRARPADSVRAAGAGAHVAGSRAGVGSGAPGRAAAGGQTGD